MEEKGTFSCTITRELDINVIEGQARVDMNKMKQEFNVSDGLIYHIGFGENGLTAHGCKIYIEMLLESLGGQIHYMHQKGYMNDAENLRACISRLEDHFIRHPKIIEKTNEK
jgi:hypothetical protein